MSLLKISRYRTEIMGFATLWVVFYHAPIVFANILAPIKFIKEISYSSVDIFFFLSGLGLFYSWNSQKKSLTKFYKTRFLKILPSYWIVVSIYFLFLFIYQNEFSLNNFLSMMLGINFYLYNDKIFWFIPSILVCYLIFPLIVNFIGFENNNSLQIIHENLIKIIIFALILSWLITATDFYYLLIFTLRIPIFIIGIYAGYILIHNEPVPIFENIKINGIILSLCILLFNLIFALSSSDMRWRLGLFWYPCIMIAYPLCLTIALFFDYIDNFYSDSIFLKNIKNMFYFFGKYSLQIYLIHVTAFKILQVNI
ncbi:MAG: acyltransferase family protein [Nostoc sp. ChiQUE02]|uniref:acyltransferase family protein n=1 Tax=Nostoc sp. ChiQUE02 TaxID=3075377 RepID=UPI002AD1F9F6|nr:acyltransferase family protein [Nostoc sp. ChiQUE02]MDZ8234078.1 acyltransferase family protein [Nostoc sp. ChiQUE02]